MLIASKSSNHDIIVSPKIHDRLTLEFLCLQNVFFKVTWKGRSLVCF